MNGASSSLFVLSTPKDSFPAPAYTRTVLAVNFEDAKRFFLDSLLDIQFAHGLMLLRQHLLTRDEAIAIFGALDSLDRTALNATSYSGSSEDLFFYIEALLVQTIGVDVAGKLHTARSRNDIDITLYRMEIRKRLLGTLAEIIGLARTLHGHRGAAPCTPSCQRTPIRNPHSRPRSHTTSLPPLSCCSATRAAFGSAFETVNRNPLGACAITTTGFPIDRQ